MTEAQALADEIKRLAQQWALAEVRDTDDCATLGESLASAIDRLAAMAQPLRAREALELIATPQRPDGSWNRDREACRRLAAEALGLAE